MIKFLLKSLIVVILFIMLIPLSRVLIWLVAHVFSSLSSAVCGVDPMGVVALLLIGVALLLIVIAIKA